MVPSFPDLVQDVTTVIFAVSNGLVPYKMSMVSREWNAYCTSNISNFTIDAQLEFEVNNLNILWILKYYNLIPPDKVMKRVCGNGNKLLVDIIVGKETTKEYFRIISQIDNTSIWDHGLFSACKHRKLKIAKLMIELGATQINYAMEIASERGYIEIVQLMLEKGAINLYDAINSACIGGHINVVKLMLDRGANILSSALEFATNSDNYDPDIIKLLREHGAKLYSERVFAYT